MIRVTLLVAGPIQRAGLRSLLEAEPDLEVVDSAGQIPVGLDFGGQPDVLVLDRAALFDPSLAQAVEAHSPDGVLALSDDGQALRRAAALPVSAWGVVPEEAEPEAIIAAIRSLNAGLAVFPAALLPPSRSLPWRAPGEQAEPLVDSLTERETEVLELLAQGMPNKQIALELFISEHTVKFHVSSICSKLGASNRTEAVREGLRRGLISL